jgi:hypothetical protein
MHQLANNAIITAQDKFNINLDFTENNLQQLENLLQQAHERYKKATNSEYFPNISIENTVRIWGSYLGEVVRHSLGGDWIVDQKNVFLQIGLRRLDPLGQVRSRIVEGPQFNIQSYFQQVKSGIPKEIINRPLMKKCPFCAEEIQGNAIICRYCGRDLPRLTIASNKKITYSAKDKLSNRGLKIGLLLAFIVIILVGSVFGYKINSDNQIRMENTAEAQQLIQIQSTQEAVVAAEVATEARETDYKSNFLAAAENILPATYYCNQADLTISSAWSTAIDNGWDINLATSDVVELMTNNGTIAKINNYKNIIDLEMVSLQNPIPSYVDSYNLLLDIYGDYSYLCYQAQYPTGSLLAFNQGMNDKITDFFTNIDKLLIILPDLKQSIPSQIG